MSILSEKHTDYIKQKYYNTIDIISKKKKEFSELMGSLYVIINFPLDIDYFYDFESEISEQMQVLFGIAQNNIASKYIDLHFAKGSVYSFRARCSDLYNDLRKISDCVVSGQKIKVDKNALESNRFEKKKISKKKVNIPEWMTVIK